MSDAALKDRQATLAGAIITVPVDYNTTGDKTVRAIPPGKRFAVYGIFLKCETSANALTWKSGSTAISGAFATTAPDTINIFSEIPILKGRANGDDLVLNVGVAAGVRGWVNLTEVSF